MTFSAVFAVVVHVCWAFLSRWFNFVFLACAALIVVRPFAGLARFHADDVIFRYMNIYPVIVMAMATALWAGMKLWHGRTTRATLIFYGYLVFASVYSIDPPLALKAKLLGMIVFVAGMGLALTLGNRALLYRNLRLLILPCATVAVVYLIGGIDSGKGRLDLYDTNPNAIGHLAASCAILMAYVACWDKRILVRLGSLAVAAALIIVILESGSRTALASTAIGILIVILPILRRPDRMIVAGLGIIIALWVAQMYVDLDRKVADRLSNWETTTGRWELWHGWIERTPNLVFGSGALIGDAGFGTQNWANSHSIYVQVLCELGFVGLAVFLLLLVYTGKRWISAARAYPGPERWLAGACIAFALASGFGESMAITGNGLPALLWGFGIGLIDQMLWWGRATAEAVPQAAPSAGGAPYWSFAS